MKAFNFAMYGIAAATFVVCGCASTPSARGPIPAKFYSKAELEGLDEVKLPPNYSVDNFRKMQMVMNVKIESADGKTKIDKGLSTRMQTEMAKLKRFEIFSLHNRSKVELDAIGDLDEEVKVVEADQVKASDLMLTGTIKVTCAINELSNEKVYVYSADGDFSCEDAKTRTVFFAEKARFGIARSGIRSLGRLMATYQKTRRFRSPASGVSRSWPISSETLSRPVAALRT